MNAIIFVAFFAPAALAFTANDITGEYTSWREKYLDPATTLHITGCVASLFDYNVPSDLGETVKTWYYSVMRNEQEKDLCSFFRNFKLSMCYERKIPHSHVNYVLSTGRKLCQLVEKKRIEQDAEDFVVEIPPIPLRER